MNTVELSTSSIFESTMSTRVSVKTPTQRWTHTLLALINFFKRLSTTSLLPSPACSWSRSICSSCYPLAKDGKHFRELKATGYVKCLPLNSIPRSEQWMRGNLSRPHRNLPFHQPPILQKH